MLSIQLPLLVLRLILNPDIWIQSISQPQESLADSFRRSNHWSLSRAESSRSQNATSLPTTLDLPEPVPYGAQFASPIRLDREWLMPSELEPIELDLDSLPIAEPQAVVSGDNRQSQKRPATPPGGSGKRAKLV